MNWPQGLEGGHGHGLKEPGNRVAIFFFFAMTGSQSGGCKHLI
jgi:hypothetical protein